MELVAKWEQVLNQIEEEFSYSSYPLRSKVFDRHVGAMRVVLWKLKEDNVSFSAAAETYRHALQTMKLAAKQNDRVVCVRYARYLRCYWLNSVGILSK